MERVPPSVPSIPTPKHRVIYDKREFGMIRRLIDSIQRLIHGQESTPQEAAESFEARSQVTELFHGATSVMHWVDISTGAPKISKEQLGILLDNAYQELERYHPDFMTKEDFVSGCKTKMRRFADWLERTSNRSFFTGSEGAVQSAINHIRNIT